MAAGCRSERDARGEEAGTLLRSARLRHTAILHDRMLGRDEAVPSRTGARGRKLCPLTSCAVDPLSESCESQCQRRCER